MQRAELAAWLRLTLTPGCGNDTARKLLAAFGLPQAIFDQTLPALTQIVSVRQAQALQAEPPELAPLLEATWAWLQVGAAESPSSAPGTAPVVQRQIVALGDAQYPAPLLNIEDPPLMLYLMGVGHLGADGPYFNLQRSLAMVGSRNPTAQGVETARAFAKSLKGLGLTIVSGLALGIDSAAHLGALDEPDDHSHAVQLPTIAVVGTGLDRVYPKKNLALAHRIAQRGLIVSEFPLGTPPLVANFPRRNRIIAGLAQGTLVVEAALKSGSLITARLAAEQGKEVFAIPGSIHSVQSRGCHALIRQGAKLVETTQDILEDLRLEQALPVAPLGDSDDDSADSDGEGALLEALGFDPVSLDALQARTGLPTPDLQAQLMTLELDGVIARLPGGLFQRIGAA
jgi:DNA processing protein